MYDGPDTCPLREPPTRALGSPDPADRDPRMRVAHVAAFVCREVERIAREVGFPLAVIAATSDPGRHAARLSATRHAGWSPRNPVDWFMPFDDGLALPQDLAYRQLRFDPRWLGPCPLPRGVALASGSLVVNLPLEACAADLSAVLRTGLADFSYDRVARRPDRVRHRYATNRPVVVAPRYALVEPGVIDRLVAVEDLFAFRPADLASLARAVALAHDALMVGVAMAGAERDAAGEVSRG